MSKALVTGAAGFVGRHVLKRLLEAGYEVHAVDCIAEYTEGIDPEKAGHFSIPATIAGFISVTKTAGPGLRA
ncbi:MAG TPA: NAD-dependent epimerase/dehydratase family protein [Acidobacteriaceae bacterium]|nr:NAD-dependent epimerase/dehydratase family protein [Acidobacteriaceae bacterium]